MSDTVTKTTYFNIQRKIVANMTTESWQNVPHVGYVYEPDVTDFFAEYKNLNKRDGKAKISFNTIIMKAITEGVKAAPACNAHLEFNRKTVSGCIKQIKEINVSTPMILPNGEMMTINLHNIGERSLDNITELMAETAEKLKKTDLGEAMYSVSMDNTLTALKKGKIATVLGRLFGAKFGKSKVKNMSRKAKKEYKKIPENQRIIKHDIEQGTITISNIGSTYRNQHGTATLLEIIPPQVVVFCVGAVQKRPIVVTDENGNDKIEIRQVLPINVCFDHRALDYGDLIPLFEKMDSIFAEPKVVYEWLDK